MEKIGIRNYYKMLRARMLAIIQGLANSNVSSIEDEYNEIINAIKDNSIYRVAKALNIEKEIVEFIIDYLIDEQGENINPLRNYCTDNASKDGHGKPPDQRLLDAIYDCIVDSMNRGTFFRFDKSEICKYVAKMLREKEKPIKPNQKDKLHRLLIQALIEDTEIDFGVFSGLLTLDFENIYDIIEDYLITILNSKRKNKNGLDNQQVLKSKSKKQRRKHKRTSYIRYI